jgi:type I restriction enzyme S subunit
MQNLITEFYDGPHATPPPATEGPIFLGIKNLAEDGHLDLSEIRHIAEKDFPRWIRRVQPQPGDVVFTYEASLHRYAIIPEGFRGCLGRRIALIRPDPGVVDTRFLLYVFLSPLWRATVMQRINIGSTVDRIPLIDFPNFPIALPDLSAQQTIAAVLSTYDELIENNSRRIQILEEMAQAIYREWFVELRYPGHEGVPLLDSDLGPIPVGWDVSSIAHLAAPQKYSVTSGPFGSKLGRRDYVASGVPVIRGANLAVGGGFQDADFVYVSESKADELVSCIARPGDIVVTQRGTLGQVGLIPASARHGRYVLSQSQMKVTVDDEQASHHYLYAVLRSPEAAERIQNMAMSAGVPHINLTMLRNFSMVLPARPLQAQFEALVSPMLDLAENLHSSNESLRVTRDLLLPRLISGEIDVSELDICSRDAAA